MSKHLEAAAPAHPLRLLVGALGASVLVYLLSYRLDALAALGPLRNLTATLLATPLLALALRASVAVQAERALSTRGALALLLMGLVALRLAIPLELICGSDDAYRYLWDGKVLLHAINPYRFAPASPELAGLRDTLIHPQIFRPDMRTVYPPLAQFWFAVAQAVGQGSAFGLKLVYLLHDGVATVLLVILLRRRRAPALRALLYAWSPLLVVQGYAAAHLDPLLVPWLLAALLWSQRRPWAAGAALGCAAMVRPLAAICGPALALRRPVREGLLVVAGFLLVGALLTLPYLGAGRGLVESLLIYAQHWRFNGFLFRPLELLFGEPRWFRLAVNGAIGLVAITAALLPISRPARALVALAAYVVLAPTIYPWYLIAALALAALYSGPLPLLLPALVTLSDLVFVDGRVGGPWKVPTRALLSEYGGLCLISLWQLRQHGRSSTSPTPPRGHFPLSDQS